jgi:DNA-binding NtrC family response regulator
VFVGKKAWVGVRPAEAAVFVWSAVGTRSRNSDGRFEKWASMMKRILLFGDHPSSAEMRRHLQNNFDVDRVEFTDLPARLSQSRVGLVIAAVDCSVLAGELKRSLRATPSGAPVFVIVPVDANEKLLHDVAEFSADFVLWPARVTEILHRIYRIIGQPPEDVEIVRERILNEIGLKQVVGRDPAFLRIVAQIPIIARCDRPVVITGETGTGKEVCARAIHHLGPRRKLPFIAVDCGAFPDHLFENEMFGHVRGAFTDAYRDQQGLVAMAEGGTLFLDEIDSLSTSSQAKLLRFLQEQTYRSLGSDRFVQAHVNVIAATNQDLECLVREKRFRPDLFFRLAVLRLHIMPLRERIEDIPILAQHFLDMLCAEKGIPAKVIAPATLAQLRCSDWPGNVRELFNVVQQAFAFAEGPQILPFHLTSVPEAAQTGPVIEGGNFRAARARTIEIFERNYVTDLLRAHHGNITQAARAAGHDRRAFGRLVKRHHILSALMEER